MLLYISLFFLGNPIFGKVLAELETKDLEFVAGSVIELSFCIYQQEKEDELILLLDNGTARVQTSKMAKEGYISFVIPYLISEKSGLVMARLYTGSVLLLKSSFEVLPKISHVSKLESYCGPKHLVVDRNDYSMVISTVLDLYDNPFPKEEQIKVAFHSANEITQSDLKMRPLFGFKKLHAPDKKGYGTVVSSYEEISDKSFRLDYYALDPLNFSISCERQHKYADGQQLVVFKTSLIEDASGNTIGNGTVVRFRIENGRGEVSELYAQTISGIATCVRYAPEQACSWSVSADIAHYAKNIKRLTVNFLASVSDFNLGYQKKEGSIIIGPVTGYMGQWVKNGMIASIEISGDATTKFFKKPVKDGMVIIPIRKLQLAKGDYTMNATIAGISKDIKFTIND